MKTEYGKYFGNQWNDPDLEVKCSTIAGKGIYSKRFIKKNEIVMTWGGILFTAEDLKAGKAKPNSTSGFKEGLFLGQPFNGPETIDQYLNHSCNPNLWMLDEITIAACRDIAVGEELTADYACWEIESIWIMPHQCNCGSQICRKIITGNDWKLSNLQEKYKGHFLPCINKRIQNLITLV